MFIIPVGNKVDWKRPPVVTLFLVLANCFVFFFLQAGDYRQDAIASNYYYSAQLPDWEFERYWSYLENNSTPGLSDKFIAAISVNYKALSIMERDAKFMRELHAGHIVTPRALEFPVWSAQRNVYESMQSFTTRYIFRPDDPHFVTSFTSVFMHANLDHLFGNMVVLFLVGFLVESVIGKTQFMLAYLVSAYTGDLMYGLTAHNWCLGASGAISGVMGLYSVIFGMRKIDVFYTLGFYFDYVRAPAIALLPLWLGNEAYQFFYNHGSNVGYMAHFGGLLGGAVMGALYVRRSPDVINSNHEIAASNEVDSKDFNRGMDFLGRLEFKKALREFKKLLEKHPDDVNLMRLAYRAAKADPSSEDYHRAALRLLSLTDAETAIPDHAHTIFHEYMSCARPAPRLGKSLIVKLANEFSATSHSVDAEKLAGWLHSTSPAHADLPAILLALARGYYRENNKEKFTTVLQSVIQQFPQTEEAASAADMLRVG